MANGKRIRDWVSGIIGAGYFVGVDKVGELESEKIPIEDFADYVGITALNRSFDATVGTDGDYATIQLALADSKNNLKIISNITETVDWGEITNPINIIGDELYTVDVTALTCTSDLFISAKNIDFSGISQTTFTTASRLLIYDTNFATGFTIYNNNVTVKDCNVNSGTITVNAVADNTTIDNCNTTTAIVDAGTNTKTINCTGSSNLLQEDTTIIGSTNDGSTNALALKDAAENSIVDIDTDGNINSYTGDIYAKDGAGTFYGLIVRNTAGGLRLQGNGGVTLYDNTSPLALFTGGKWFFSSGTLVTTKSTGNIYAPTLGGFGFYRVESTDKAFLAIKQNYVDDNNRGLDLFYKNANTHTIGIGISKDGDVKIGTGTASERLDVDGNVKLSGVFKAGKFTATEASALTPEDADFIYVTDTDATFTSVGFWGYENGAWTKL